MTTKKMPTVDELKLLPKGTSFYLSFKSLFLWGGIIGSVLLGITLFISNILVDNRRDLLEDSLFKRMEILASSRADVFQTWQTSLLNIGGHITDADVVRLFATEMEFNAQAVAEGTSEGNVALLAQLPYMQKVMADYVAQNNLVQSYMVSSHGDAYLSSISDLHATALQIAGIKAVFAGRKALVMPMHESGGELLVDVIKPVFMLEEMDRNPAVVGVLVTVFNVTDVLKTLLAPHKLAQKGEVTYLVQQSAANAIEQVLLDNDVVAIRDMNPSFMAETKLETQTVANFIPHESPVDGQPVFISTAQVGTTIFNVVQELDVKTVLAPIAKYRNGVYAFSLLAVLFIGALLSGFMIHVIGIRNRSRVNHQQQVLKALVKSVELRDTYLSGHHERVAKIAIAIGNRMRLSVPERSTLYYSAMLSGVGKIFIPQNILTKPGKLTKKEMETLQGHIEYAMQVLEDMEFDFPISEVIYQMSERMDGSGYPNKKEGADINLLSRILAVCDVYCALTRPRSYRKEMDVVEALAIIDKESDRFDKGVIGVLKGVALEE